MESAITWAGAAMLCLALVGAPALEQPDTGQAGKDWALDSLRWSPGDAVRAHGSAFAGGGVSIWIDGHHIAGVRASELDGLRWEASAALAPGEHQVRALLADGRWLGAKSIEVVAGAGLTAVPVIKPVDPTDNPAPG